MEASPVLMRNFAGFALASLVSLLLAACDATTSVPRFATDGPHVAPEARPRPDWSRVEARGWLDQAGFSLLLPPGWTLTELQGMDSYVGEITGDGYQPDVRLRIVFLGPEPGERTGARIRRSIRGYRWSRGKTVVGGGGAVQQPC